MNTDHMSGSLADCILTTNKENILNRVALVFGSVLLINSITLGLNCGLGSGCELNGWIQFLISMEVITGVGFIVFCVMCCYRCLRSRSDA
jgi:preprotein translocase subunit SecG